MINGYVEQAKNLIDRIEAYIDVMEANELTDEQFFIEFEDKLNKLSIKDHKKND